jgi:hypothetical protein
VKSEVHRWLEDADFRKVLDSAATSSRTLSALIALTYSEDPLICWRAIDAVGRCAERYSAGRPQVFRKYLNRLFWMMSDESGTVAPHAPEVIGEIIQSNVKLFEDFVPLTISLLNLEPEDLPAFLPGILYALTRIGAEAPGSIEDALDGIEEALTARDAQSRAMAVLCLGRTGYRDILSRNPGLEKDTGRARIYSGEGIRITTVARLYRDALARPASVMH